MPPARTTVTELRQYTLKPGMRGRLLSLFETELLDPLEKSGMTVGGLFRDRDDPDRFVWLRHFPDMDSRKRALESFYFGGVWARHGAAANETMIDSDNVLLLRDTDPPHLLPPQGEALVAGWTILNVLSFPPSPRLTSWLAAEFQPLLREVLAVPVATWQTEPAKNTFPRLPVRDDNVFVWTATFARRDDCDNANHRIEVHPQWTGQVRRTLESHVTAQQCLRLAPTRRSKHHQPLVQTLASH